MTEHWIQERVGDSSPVALPPSEIDGKPWYERVQDWPSSSDAGLLWVMLLFGAAFLVSWVILVVPLLLGPPEATRLCSDGGCLTLPPAQEWQTVSFDTLFLGGLAAGGFFAAARAWNRWRQSP
jgi:hypothetical protein